MSLDPIRSTQDDGNAVSLKPKDHAERRRGMAFRAVLIACLGVGVAALVILMTYVTIEGAPAVSPKLFQNFGSTLPDLAGAQSAIVGTIYFIVLVFFIAVPVGVGAAIHMEEYADRNRWYNRLIEVNIQNLAAVPSIVFGILGLAVIARGLGFGTGTLISGALTLSLLVLPTVIIAAREALRAVPNSIREGAMALGATKWQAISRQVLPAAIPGMATGSILALSRAIGETAPLLMLAVPVFLPQNPTGLFSEFTSLPVQIYSWTVQPNPKFGQLAAAAIVVLLAILLVMNTVAILIRNRYQRSW